MRSALALLALVGCAHSGRGPLDGLIEFSRAQDGAGADRVIEKLLDGEAVERAYAAFALGQLGVAWDRVDEPVRASAERVLVAELRGEKDPIVRDRIVEALGKLGAETAVPSLAESLAGAQRARAALALGVMVKSGRLKHAVEVPRLIALLDDSDGEARFASAYALFRMKTELARAALRAHLADRDWLVRATLLRGLGELGAVDEDLPEVVRLIDDPDERVAAEAARALARTAVACSAEHSCAALDALNHSGEWRDAVAAAIAAEPILHADAVALFAARAKDDCLLALAHDRALGRVERITNCEGDARRRAVLSARALGEARPSDDSRHALAALFEHKDAAVRAQAAESLGKLTSHAADELLAQHLADESDPAALAATAEAVGARQIAGVELTLRNRLAHISGVASIEAIQALAGAAGALNARETIPVLLQFTRDPVAAVRSAASAAIVAMHLPKPEPVTAPIVLAAEIPDRSVRLQTTRGPIVLHLFGGDAPRTVENFLKLVRAKFYDGLTFHRVVPDFVAQGGDPRGDGSGGPGWVIPCEINQRRYREGTLGMALSGRDTGGSQFFIALSPQPHLDGRYTIFGEVSQGMETARALREGDRIVSAALVE